MPKNPVWGEDETKLYEAIVKTQDVNVLNPPFENLKEPNAFHLWKDVSSDLTFILLKLAKFFPFQADFSLLFHASVGNNLVAVEKLLEAGADPSLQNLNGTNVFVLFVKRSQIEMADMCLAKVPEEKRAAVLNASSTSGWTPLMTAAENGQVWLNRYWNQMLYLCLLVSITSNICFAKNRNIVHVKSYLSTPKSIIYK